ncbi:efflux RND transporter permease subunit [Pseudoteredinibacter isoporae]|uniref:Multidrug efflux pump subunit AcrB n=1 Tax=Pseudoteredinibacter isoporae TaxID=570281 RepID=A0A7X0JUT8_9GAMM|nr:efflux RND transporter permease subunit [Pseudoteredinibacter isoporae]MBB6522665.1 multidrug efflux pump subunit AcrB [Pseudoteredinibacter isoporae]NHO88196.1 efflux RND transporter permease subunit [Pseudoteredinibacter isoporae]NIB23473.1 efflux RND transporter permease subunit [Pseudoteredinibacter isoporae]
MDAKSSRTGLIAWFVHNPVAANLLMLLILLVGIGTASSLRIEGFPTIEPNRITIDIRFESGDPKQAEEGIAIKVEEALKGQPGIRQISSTSSNDSVSIVVEKVHDYPLDRLTAEVKNIVDGIASFPAAAEKPIVSQQQWEDSAIWVTAYGDVAQSELQNFSRRIESELLKLTAVNKISRSGWRVPEIAIELDEQALQGYGLSLADIVDRVRAESISASSGELRSEKGLILLKADKQRYQAREFGDIVIRSLADGRRLLLKDVATIRDGYEEAPKVLSRFDGKTAITLKIAAGRSDNIIDIAEQVKAHVNGWQNSADLPQGIQLEVWWDQSQNMIDRLNLILENGFIGILLVMLVLTVFLNFRVALWVAMGLPICFAGGLILMGASFWDLTLNQLTTFGFILVLGILVDDAVVVGESVYSARKEFGDTVDSTIHGVQRIAVPTAFGVLTTVAAFFPLSLVEGQLGSLFSQFALVCTACLLFSLVESKLILPAHLRNLNTQRRDEQSGKNVFAKSLGRVQNWADEGLSRLNSNYYQPLLSLALRYRYAALLCFISCFVLVVGLVPSGRVAFSFFPDIPEDYVSVSFRVSQGGGYGLLHQQVDKVELAVKALDAELQARFSTRQPFISKTYSLVEDDRSGLVQLELNKAIQEFANPSDIALELQKHLSHYEGLQELIVSTDDFEDKDVELNILSDNPSQLNGAANLLAHKLKQISGVHDVHNNYAAVQPVFLFELTALGRSLGFSTAELAQQIQQSFYGAEVQRVQRGKDEVKVRVRYPYRYRQDVTSLESARVRSPSGEVLPLSTVATVRVEHSQLEIHRVSNQRAATVSANLHEQTISSSALMDALENTVFPEIQRKYPGIEVVAEGDAAEEEESSDSLVQIFMLSLFLIYFLLAVPLKSYWQPFVIMSAIPFGIVGAILGHWFNDLAISILSINGILALSGVVVNDSLLLLNQFNLLRSKGLGLQEALVQAGSLRMRAIVLTTLTTVLGLVSLLQETASQALFLIPAATSLAYGISFATLVTLILVPVTLMIAHDVTGLFSRLRGKLKPYKSQAQNSGVSL